MSRKYNFSAGPAALPDAVLEKAQAELLDWQGRGLSVMEMSHRSAEYVAVADKAEQDLRRLMAIPDNYQVLFLQGGATSQFSMIPMNLMQGKRSADYINTGDWSAKAIKEAQRYIDVNVAASCEADNFTSVPTQADLELNPDAAYVHYTPNETIRGVEFDYIPDTGDVPLVADMSSNILSCEIDVSRFGVIYAGAQKNIGPAGLTVVIIRDDLLAEPMAQTPSLFSYKAIAAAKSMLNTPPTFGWYLAGLVFEWLGEKGGVAAMQEVNSRKAEKLYGFIDGHDFYSNPVVKTVRSKMNVPFILAKPELDKLFLSEAADSGLLNLSGHRSVGGMRASIYNAVPESAVDALISFMETFANSHR